MRGIVSGYYDNMSREEFMFLRNGQRFRPYEERTRDEYMDARDKLFASERGTYGPSKVDDLQVNPAINRNFVSNQLFNKLKKQSRDKFNDLKNHGYNYMVEKTMKNSRPQYNIPQLFSTDLLQREIVGEYNRENALRGIDLKFERPLKWNFKLDPTFLAIESENKMIGIRSISIPRQDYDFDLVVEIKKAMYIDGVLDEAGTIITANIHVEVGAFLNISEVCSEIEKNVNDAIWEGNKSYNQDFIWNETSYKWMLENNQVGNIDIDESQGFGLDLINAKITCRYSPLENNVVFETFSFSPKQPDRNVGIRYDYVLAIGQPMDPYENDPPTPDEIRNRNDERLYKIAAENQFRRVFNQKDTDDITRKWGYKWILHNVWNRRDLYIHASFSSFPHNHIGHNDEFYTKPSKLYKYDSKSPDIELWASLDGKNPVILYDQNFTVELELILNVNYPNIY
jgi:hypothetical protein